MSGGDARLTQVTGAGCSLGALSVGFLDGSENPFHTVVAAHARGTGSFAVAFLDKLSLLDPV